ncbi:T9SS type A sorting domain-containing protein [Adhaeribacter soli]|uniref:T9SS type A sorting domain-containing protein n=1 Tax=Adhaeribacter soli TaxID=2607655 RepID=A0A5N1IXR9_9BACT|nr:T9SS type A sorting domain-containing protein [Adhaeribacter soli]KAA9339024.1 T9SS type A sorting domain-containing protein [Adhaeribacter soli]
MRKNYFAVKAMAAATMLAATFFPGAAKAQWQKTSGPGANMVADLVPHRNALFLGTQGGIYKSNNQGAVWEFASQGIPHRGLYSLLSTSQALVSGSYNGIFRSTDGGQTWVQPITGMSTINELTQNSTTLFAATDMDGIKLSNDQGATWTRVGHGVVGNLITTIATHGSYVFADGNNTLLRSADNGQTWTAHLLTSLGLPNQSNVNSLSSVGNQLFAGMNNQGLFVSNNNGSSFVAANSGLPAPGLFSVEHVIQHGQVLLAGLMGHSQPVYVSTNGGQSWAVSSTGMRHGDGVRKFYSDGTDLYASTARGLYKSTDSGATWNLQNQGITNGFVDALVANSAFIFAGLADRGTGGTQNLYRSPDNGQTWEAINNGVATIQVKAILATDQLVLVGGNNRTLYRSTNNGQSWANVSLTNSINSDAAAFTQIGNNLFLISENNAIFKSSDLGQTWVQASGSSVNPLGRAIYSDGNNIYAAAGTYTYQSSDQGNTWSSTGSISASTHGTSFYTLGNYVYLGTRNNGMYRRLKTATSWTAINNGIPQPTWITSITGYGDSLFASTDYSSSSYQATIYLSTDSGATWNQFNQGLPTNIGLRSLLVRNNHLFAGTGSLYNNDGRSVWYRALNSNITGLNEVLQQETASIYPNPNHGNFRIKNLKTGSSISVTDVQGKTVYQTREISGGTETRIDLPHLKSGLYFVIIHSKGGIQKQKLLIQ